MKAYKYAVEGYNDWIHQKDFFRGTKYYIPAPYNLGVFIQDNKIKAIYKQVAADPTPLVNRKMPVVEEIEMEESFAKQLFDNYCQQQLVEEQREQLLELFEQFKTDDDKADDLYDQAMAACNQQNYAEAIEKFSLSNRYNSRKGSVLYNMACCYCKLGNKGKMLEYLDSAIKAGYRKWRHMVCDTDLNSVVDDKDFIERIKPLIAANRGTDDHPNRTYVREYLKKHNL